MKTTAAAILLLLAFARPPACVAQGPQPAPIDAAPAVVLPLDRTAYFIGETVPLALAVRPIELEAVNADGPASLYSGRAGALWLDTSKLAPGDYALSSTAPGLSTVLRSPVSSEIGRLDAG